MQALTRGAFVAGTATLLLAANVGPAAAQDGSAFAAGKAAWTNYTDNGDRVTVCDNRSDKHGAVGWIEIKQSNGSYKRFPRVYNGRGAANGCVTATQDVLRETSTVKVVSCLVDGPSGKAFNCGLNYWRGT